MLVLRLLADRAGTTAIEYSLIAMLVAVAAIGGITAVGQSSTLQMQEIADSLPNGT